MWIRAAVVCFCVKLALESCDATFAADAQLELYRDSWNNWANSLSFTAEFELRFSHPSSTDAKTAFSDHEIGELVQRARPRRELRGVIRHRRSLTRITARDIQGPRSRELAGTEFGSPGMVSRTGVPFDEVANGTLCLSWCPEYKPLAQTVVITDQPPTKSLGMRSAKVYNPLAPLGSPANPFDHLDHSQMSEVHVDVHKRKESVQRVRWTYTINGTSYFRESRFALVNGQLVADRVDSGFTETDGRKFTTIAVLREFADCNGTPLPKLLHRVWVDIAADSPQATITCALWKAVRLDTVPPPQSEFLVHIGPNVVVRGVSEDVFPVGSPRVIDLDKLSRAALHVNEPQASSDDPDKPRTSLWLWLINGAVLLLVFLALFLARFRSIQR